MKKTYICPMTIVANVQMTNSLLGITPSGTITIDPEGSGGSISNPDGVKIRPWQGNFDREEW